jgi:serine/threonine protein kinase
MPNKVSESGGPLRPSSAERQGNPLAGTQTETGGAAGEEPATAAAPTFRPAVSVPQGKSGLLPENLPEPGHQVDDFEIVRVLGEGAFARVFLARQLSLDRQVALKISANRGSEARTLASLEHTHIVQVFLECIDRTRGLRLLCMQYVPGTTLEFIIDVLAGQAKTEWSGRALLEAVDSLSTHPPMLDPTALRDREWLAGADWAETVYGLGSRLAEALAYAHRQGVLHRDIKPANILVNPYGRPLLADFNIALDPHRVRGPAGEMFGGTLAYMAPEHLDALNPDDPTTPAAVDERSDIYSLGVVLYEMWTGQLPFAGKPRGERGSALRTMAERRRARVPSARRRRPETPDILERTLGRCLDPLPAHRFQTGEELAQALDGCRELETVQRALPSPGLLTRAALRHPFRWMAMLAILPHLVGSIVNITYNMLQIVGDLTPTQHDVFSYLVLGYNLLVYPAAFAVLSWQVAGPLRTWRSLRRSGIVADDRVVAARGRILGWPLWMMAMSCVGWFPGGLLFPLGIHLLAGPVPLAIFAHFLISFTVSGLIALTYSYFGVQFIVLRVLYPRFWTDARQLRQRMAAELRARPRLVQVLAGIIPLLAGIIPLTGAILMVAGGPEVAASLTYRVLVSALIVLGMAGFGLALLANKVLSETLTVLLRTEGRAAD